MVYPEFSRATRVQKLAELSQSSAPVYDAVVIGGGIVGAGLLRELAIRGVNALLVEKKDFASGTSSKSSKLVHGGLRYLEMFDFGVVLEALSERHWLLKTHPHLVS
ncbi:MAG TPA: FAD-dependent oxidoreductase, partial [Oligoflexia bacterium]|nr:FAD-dependent oxidoreductase [Oligoflexia bacterium]